MSIYCYIIGDSIIKVRHSGPLVHLCLPSLRLIPKNSDFFVMEINIGDVMPWEFYFFVPLTLSTKDHESL